MHGVMFTSLREYLGAEHGAETASRVFADEQQYVLSEAYPDDRFRALIDRAATATRLTDDELLYRFGVFAGQTVFVRLYPTFFEVAQSAREFLLVVEQRIHELVRATIPGASPPQLFISELDGDDGMLIVYTSPRRLCALLRGVAEGSARSFGETTEIVETSCMRKGDLACRFELRLSPAAAHRSA